MSPPKVSIRAQLTLFIMVLASLLFAMGGLAAARLIVINAAAKEIDHKWLAVRGLLGDLRSHLAHFRIAEIDRTAASDAGERARIEQLGFQDAQAVEVAQDRYDALVGSDNASGERLALRQSIQAYFAAHDRWEAADTGGYQDAEAANGGPLERLYNHAATATDGVIDANTSASAKAGRRIERLVSSTVYLMLAFSVIALIVVIWLLERVKHNISIPLEAITVALTRLAAGDRDVAVPERGRKDEIGQMARAFDVFCANALALEQALEATRIAQETAQALARYDVLTGLANRRVFSTELEAALTHVDDDGRAHAVLLVDLDRFKPVNDLYGHAAGDLVLCEVAKRLMEQVGPQDMVARLGGDEFALLVSVPVQTAGDITKGYGQRVLAALRKPFVLKNVSVTIDASVGIVQIEAGRGTPGEILRAADIAMYRAKREGRGTVRFFAPAMDQELLAQAAMEADLRKAIADEQIEAFYQPIVDLRRGEIYGYEILARWHHPHLGPVSPERFVPIAEQIGLIGDLTWTLLRNACRAWHTWPVRVHLSLNISPYQLRDPMLAAHLLSILTQEGFPPVLLDVEVTESALVDDLQVAKATLTSLQNLGVRISLDDFGTGYSSLYHLSELRFDKVKIDRSFVQSMCANNDSEKIVDAVLSLAKSLSLPTVAEGIEETGVAEHLAQKGCEYGQGYLFGKAMKAHAAAAMLARDRDLIAVAKPAM